VTSLHPIYEPFIRAKSGLQHTPLVCGLAVGLLAIKFCVKRNDY